MEKKGPFNIVQLKALSPGVQVWGKYLILEKNSRRTKDGREVINLKVGDDSGEIDTVVWDSCTVSGTLESGSVIGLLGDLGVYNNRLQVTAKRIKILEEDPLPYLRRPDVNLEELQKEFRGLLASIADPHMAELLGRIFTPALQEAFVRAPAAKRIHHNYSGGLLEHTLSVARLCDRIAENYPQLNRDLVITGALLHDIGKLNEYEMRTVPRYTTEGRLLGHIILGEELLARVIREIRDQGQPFPTQLELMLKHLIISHHGSLEFGSPVIPLFPEAFVLFMMDNLDAKIFVFKNKMEESGSEDEDFTAYDNFFGQYFYTGRYGSGSKTGKEQE